MGKVRMEGGERKYSQLLCQPLCGSCIQTYDREEVKLRVRKRFITKAGSLKGLSAADITARLVIKRCFQHTEWKEDPVLLVSYNHAAVFDTVTKPALKRQNKCLKQALCISTLTQYTPWHNSDCV